MPASGGDVPTGDEAADGSADDRQHREPSKASQTVANDPVPRTRSSR
jgi:hypothetical protein